MKFQLNFYTIIHENTSENIVYEMAAIFSMGDDLKYVCPKYAFKTPAVWLSICLSGARLTKAYDVTI